MSYSWDLLPSFYYCNSLRLLLFYYRSFITADSIIAVGSIITAGSFTAGSIIDVKLLCIIRMVLVLLPAAEKNIHPFHIKTISL